MRASPPLRAEAANHATCASVYGHGTHVASLMAGTDHVSHGAYEGRILMGNGILMGDTDAWASHVMANGDNAPGMPVVLEDGTVTS